MNSLEARHHSLSLWLTRVIPGKFAFLTMPSGAGHRRYWRVAHESGTWVVMDSGVDEKFKIFMSLSEAFLAAGVMVPQVIAAETTQGFLLLTDFGEDLFEKILSESNADQLYLRAFESLIAIQRFPRLQSYSLPAFDFKHYREKMQWFIEFYLRQYLKFSLDDMRQRQLQALFDLIIEAAQQQTYTCVHYDYHCRNLCLLAQGPAGVLDFQDAVRGPVTYDLMALLRDCYIDWPPNKVQRWQEQFRLMAQDEGIIPKTDPSSWGRWCDFSSAQRHIKNIGLFARFSVLGQHSSYLDYIPRLLNYLLEISARHPQMKSFRMLLQELTP